jgi:1,4-dihydroxy-6-naphthoate synthase
MRPLRLAYSPCPNDTFIFYAWVHGLVPGAPAVEEDLQDIDTLNALALRGVPDVAKVSFHAFSLLLRQYALLHAGGALGRGVGPLLVTTPGSSLRAAAAEGEESLSHALESAVVAIPGELTTAALLVKLFAPGIKRFDVLPFDLIMNAVAEGAVDAGAIIHEGRFTYAPRGLALLLDLGKWWEEETGCALPLGGIVVRRDLGRDTAATVDRAVRGSLEYAWSSPDEPAAYIRAHAQEMDPLVCRQHIALYVNEFSADYGPEGGEAIRRLLGAAADRGVGASPLTLAGPGAGIFWDE